MIAGKNEYLNEASSELFKRLAELGVREECEARENYYREQQYFHNRINELEKGLEQKDTIIAEKTRAIDALNAKIQKLQKMLEGNGI